MAWLFPLLLLGCRFHGKGAPWTLTAPAKTWLAVCLRLEALPNGNMPPWLPQLPVLHQMDPALSLFLQRLHLEGQKGWATVYAMDTDLTQDDNCLIEIRDIPDSCQAYKKLVIALPQTKTFFLGQRLCPLYALRSNQGKQWQVIVDNDRHFWIGHPTALTRLNEKPGVKQEVALAADWVDPAAPMQGFMLGRQTDEFQSLSAVAWSMTPAPKNTFACHFAFGGTPNELQRAEPQINNLALIASLAPDGSTRPANLKVDKRRVALEALLSDMSVEAIFHRLYPGIP